MSVFVVLEGGEGAGKSTQLKRLAARLRSLEGHREVVETFEPGATPLGAGMRRLLLDPASEVDPWAEVLLYAADRAQHVAAVVRPALLRGADVVSDRFLWSSLAYQGAGRGLGMERVLAVNAVGIGDVSPDVVVVLDVPPEVGLARAREGVGGADRIEVAGTEFHVSVRAAFLGLARSHGGVVVDAAAPADIVAAAVWDAVSGVLG